MNYWNLAMEVIKEGCARWDGISDCFPFEAVMNERWPGGKGGVGHAHARTKAEVRKAIHEFYAPNDWSPEPTGMRA